MMERAGQMALVAVLFLAVVALAYGVSRWLGGRMGLITGGCHLRAREWLPMGRDRFLVLVEVAGQQFLVGVGGQSVRLVAALPSSATAAASGTAPTALQATAGADVAAAGAVSAGFAAAPRLPWPSGIITGITAVLGRLPVSARRWAAAVLPATRHRQAQRAEGLAQPAFAQFLARAIARPTAPDTPTPVTPARLAALSSRLRRLGRSAAAAPATVGKQPEAR